MRITCSGFGLAFWALTLMSCASGDNESPQPRVVADGQVADASDDGCVPSVEICDGVDNDCDPGTADGVDDPLLLEPCDGPDSDRCAEGVASCVEGMIVCDDETDDNLELCDGLDNDCNAMTVDGADEPTVGEACDGPDEDSCMEGSTVCRMGTLECNDGSDTAADICDGIDNDCNPSTPDGSADMRVGVACDGADSDLCAEGMTVCEGAEVVCLDRSGDSPDTCDGTDDDCDPSTADGSGLACPDVASGTGVCRAGACGFDCDPNRGDCNRRADDGCETDFMSSDAHCGGCMMACSAGYACESGGCVSQSALIRALSGTSVYPQAIVAGSDGHAYVTGYFNSTADFGRGSESSAGGYDMFLASYTRDGTVRWARRYGSAGSEYPRSIAMDSSGNLYVAGSFITSGNFGGSTSSSRGSSDAFLASYTSLGAHRWSRTYGSTSSELFFGVAASSSSRVAVAGYFYSSVSFGGSSLTSAGSADVVVASYSSSTGAHVRSQRFGGTGGDYARGITSPAGTSDVCITGDFSDTVMIGSTRLTSRGRADVLVACFSSLLSPRWARGYGSTGYDRGYAIASSTSGTSRTVYATGTFSETMSLGSRTLTSAGGYDAFVGAWSSVGTVLWANGYGSSGSDYGRGIAANDSNQVFVTGYFYGPLDFGGGVLTHRGSADVFTLGLSSAGAHRWSYGWGGSSSDIAYAVGVEPGGDDVFATGRFRGQADFGAGLEGVAGTAYQAFVARVGVD